MGAGKEEPRSAVPVERTVTGTFLADGAPPIPPLQVAPEGSQESAPSRETTPQQGTSVPDSFDGYVLLRPIGRGGMGEVFLARDTLLERAVAIKLIGALEPGAIARERFLREARAIARLQHPNVVAVYRAGAVAGVPYLVSELVRGGSLDRLDLPLPWADLLRVCVGLAAGLAAAHRRGVLHRDLKPANALLADDGEVKLCDFGLAKLIGSPGEEASGSATSSGASDGSTAELTREGVWLGTPRYMAPEIWRSEPATVQTDLYSLGAMFYKLASGEPATNGSTLEELRTAALAGPRRPLAELAPELDRRFSTLVDRCLAPLPAERPTTADEVYSELVALTANVAKPPPGNPYRGLRAFDAEHRALFFGRRSESVAVLELLRTDSLVIVAGDSGVGKSSLCRAGVLPLVTEGRMEERSWSTIRIVPGRHPLTELGRALARHLADDDAVIVSTLNGDARALASRLRAHLGDSRGLVVFVDQLEELVTESDLEERDAAAAALAELASRIPGVRVLATARGDFLTHLAALPGLGHEMARSLYLLGPLDRGQLREVIVGPARSSGLSFESEALVETLVAAADTSTSALPLLQFALAELWERRDEARRTIPAAALDAIGGVDGALARHADGVLAAMSPGERRAARHLLTQVVTTRGTRAYRPESEIVGDNPLARAALRALVRGRLLAVHSDDDGQPIYAVTHEALLTGWSSLRTWLDRDGERRAVHERLAVAAVEWERLSAARAVLWGAAQLAEATRVELTPAGLAGRERAFLEASLREARRRSKRRLLMMIAAPVVVLAAWSGLAFKARVDRRHAVSRQLALALPTLDQAELQRAVALTSRTLSFGFFSSGLSDVGERLWENATIQNEAAETSLQKASGPLETAFQLDSDSADARDLLARSMLERAELAQTFHNQARLDEVMARLSRIDRDETWLAQWNAPAQVAIVTAPSGARVSVARYIPGAERWSKTDEKPLGTTPVTATLSKGSYLLTLQLDGREPVRYPILLSRSERAEVRVAFPASIPDGFTYVPEGSFLYGSEQATDFRRSYLVAEPEHEVHLGSFFIGTHEVTWAQWLEFLDSQPAAIRQEHWPAADGIQLRLSDGRYSLHFKPSGFEYVALAGQPIVYHDRVERAQQDWLRFPVTGIRSVDGEAYAAWLSSSGKVPGARLCTDQEWERAARGADERTFPHGNHLSPSDANFDETYGRKPGGFGLDEVGSHPSSNSPFGVADLAGNAWEYVRSFSNDKLIFVRSGGFYQAAAIQNSINRDQTEPEFQAIGTGLRICSDAR
jgi:serine/threonine protein kinase/formylglycine-generating enzyme required for sulfatase activity